jgi:hypothetical protein
MVENTQQAFEAAAFRRLVDHLRARTDVQNIDLMGWGGFCRNCLGDWYAEAATARGAPMTREEGREIVYGMPAAEFKARHQSPASDEQMRRMEESLKRNEDYRARLSGLDKALADSFPASDPPAATRP